MTAKDGNKFVNLILLLLENLLFFRAKRSVIAVVDPVVFDSADGIHGREVTFQFGSSVWRGAIVVWLGGN